MALRFLWPVCAADVEGENPTQEKWQSGEKKEENNEDNSPQLTSSEWSLQSVPPSHLQLPWMHSPSEHWNSWPLQRPAGTFRTPSQFCGHSSEPSAQSLSSSQRHWAGTHTELLHWKELLLQVALGQDASSEPSEQSSSLSQTKEAETHWPLAHRNSLSLHSLAAGKGEKVSTMGRRWILGSF